jgi:hypothetical protein
MGTNYDRDPLDTRAQQLEKDEETARKELIRKTEIADLKKLMSSPWGRRIVWRLLEKLGPFLASYDSIAMKMAFNEGKRYMGTWLFNEIMDLCPELYMVMWSEQQEFRNGKRSGGNGEQSN